MKNPDINFHFQRWSQIDKLSTFEKVENIIPEYPMMSF